MPSGILVSFIIIIVLLFGSYNFFIFVAFLGICNVLWMILLFPKWGTWNKVNVCNRRCYQGNLLHKSQKQRLLSGSDPKHPKQDGHCHIWFMSDHKSWKDVGDYFVILQSPFNVSSSASKMRHLYIPSSLHGNAEWATLRAKARYGCVNCNPSLRLWGSKIWNFSDKLSGRKTFCACLSAIMVVVLTALLKI